MGAVISFFSAKGSPGVTTTVLALAHAWQGPVLVVEADVAAGSPILAGHLGGRHPHDRGVLGLALTLRRSGTLTEPDVWQQTLETRPGLSILPGLADPVQAGQLGPLWPVLAETLSALTGADTLIDIGRLGTADEPDDLLSIGDLVVAVSRCSLPDVYALSRRLPAVRETHAPAHLGMITIGGRDPYSPREIARKLDIALLAELPWEPEAARVLSHGEPAARRPGQSKLLGAASTLSQHLSSHTEVFSQVSPLRPVGDPA